MLQAVLISADTPKEFIAKYNAFMRKHPAVDSQTLISSTEIYVFYEVEEPKPKFCCADCDNYEWGKGCEFCEGVIRPTHEICEWFNQEVCHEVQN